MRIRGLVVVLVTLGSLSWPCVSHAYENLSLTNSRIEGTTSFTFEGVMCTDDPTAEIGSGVGTCDDTDAAVTIGKHHLDVNVYKDTYPDAVYKWSCALPGVKHWRAVVPYEDADADQDPDYPTYLAKTVTGSFTVPRCHKPVARRVPKSTAAYDAADGWDGEFVSSSRCNGVNVVRGEASLWHCAVTHNDTIRQCLTTFTIRYQALRRFGIRTPGKKVGREASRCHYF